MSRGAAGLGWLVLAGATVFTVALAFSEWSPLADRGAHEHGVATPARTGALEVAGHAADVELVGGARVHVRLARLHTDAEQQAFDARALAARLGLAEGEPFRLELELAAGSPAARVRANELTVRDERGAALAPIAPPARATEKARERAAPRDPLLTLLAPVELELSAGRVVTVCLWGRAPAEKSFLTGLAAAPVELAAGRWEADGLSDVLARVPVATEPPVNLRATGAGGDR